MKAILNRNSCGVVRTQFVAALLISFLLVQLCGTVLAQGQGKRFREDQILVQPLKHAVDELERRHRKSGRGVQKRFEKLGGMQVVKLARGEDPEAVAAELARSGLVEFAEPDYLLRASLEPNDPRLKDGSLWALDNVGQSGGQSDADIDALEAWNTKSMAREIVVAIIDSGIRYTHEDLAGNIWRNPRETLNGYDDDGNGVVDDIHGLNAIWNRGDCRDDNGHGTHVAGTIGAVANNGKGVVGVCWEVKLMGLKFLDAHGEGSTSDAIQCIEYARENGAHVINASWGGGGYSLGLYRAIRKAAEAGIIFVAAAGNEDANNDLIASYPANYSLANVISVGASTRRDLLDSNYSNYGAETVHLVAPGTAILSTWHNSDNSYATLSGTSMATPHVAGAVALLKSMHPADPVETIVERLLDGTDKLPSLAGTCRTGGRLNIGNLFRMRAPTSGRRIISPILSGSGLLQFTIEGTEPFTLESSMDCRTWKPVAEPVLIPTLEGVLVQIPANSPQAFYRIQREG